MNTLFLQYVKCSTCIKAKKWLEANNIAFEARPIVEQPPTEQELREWVVKSGLPLKKFFNTSGLVYKSLQLKDKLPQMSEDEQYRLLASDGKLVKRPLIVQGELVLVGFSPEQWKQLKK
mgnify:CR=1 FL=1